MAKKKKAEASAKDGLRMEIGIPEGVNVELSGYKVIVSAGDKSLEREFLMPKLKRSVEDGKIIITAERATRREKKMAGTLKSRLQTMFKGVTEGHTYKLKICSGHFPMNVSVSGDELVIKNFLGESVPRKITIPKDVKINVQGTDIILEGINKERVGQTAGNIEKLTRIKTRDSRTFQDGIYIVEKDGKNII